jgi:hypothetical protein
MAWFRNHYRCALWPGGPTSGRQLAMTTARAVVRAPGSLALVVNST